MGLYTVAFIGCGERGREHVESIKADPRLQVVGAADVNSDKAQELLEQGEFQGHAYDDSAQMLADLKPDVVVTCLWTRLHLPTFQACVNAGVRIVLSEKPMAPTWGECQEMAALAERSGTHLVFCHQRRHSPRNLYIRELLQKGRFGEIRRMDLFSPPNLLDCGTHTFDQALSYNQEVTAKWVLAGVDTSEALNWFGVRSESVAVGTVVFQNGVRASFQFGGPDLDLWGGVRVIGTDGYLEAIWDGEIRGAVVYSDPDWKPEPPTAEKDDDMMGYVRAAIDQLEGGPESETSYRYALRAEEIIFAAYESVRRRARVELPLVGVTNNPLHEMLGIS